MFLFHVSFGTVLHTCDLRYTLSAFHSPALHRQVGGRIDALYLDVTFAHA